MTNVDVEVERLTTLQLHNRTIITFPFECSGLLTFRHIGVSRSAVMVDDGPTKNEAGWGLKAESPDQIDGCSCTYS